MIQRIGITFHPTLFSLGSPQHGSVARPFARA